MVAPIDLLGQRFDKLVVTQFLRAQPNGKRWLCQCDCGGAVEKVTTQLRRVTNTGCKACETESRSDANTSHGGTKGGKTRLWTIWRDMRKRCRNPNHISYPYYGARGITVSLEWEDFSRFSEWALDSGYESHLSIDRIDNDKGYSRFNCRWATAAEQARNRRKKGAQ